MKTITKLRAVLKVMISTAIRLQTVSMALQSWLKSLSMPVRQERFQRSQDLSKAPNKRLVAPLAMPHAASKSHRSIALTPLTKKLTQKGALKKKARNF